MGSRAAKHRENPVGPPGCIDAAARYLATEPAAVERALAAHQADERGWCRGCGRALRWPCAVATSAQQAQLLLARHARPDDR